MANAGKETFTELMGIALPTTGSRMIGSIAWFLEPIVVAQSLAIAGVTTSMATRQYGELTGYALPLLMLPSFLTASLATSLVPAVSEANSKGNLTLVVSPTSTITKYYFQYRLFSSRYLIYLCRTHFSNSCMVLRMLPSSLNF